MLENANCRGAKCLKDRTTGHGGPTKIIKAAELPHKLTSVNPELDCYKPEDLPAEADRIIALHVSKVHTCTCTAGTP